MQRYGIGIFLLVVGIIMMTNSKGLSDYNAWWQKITLGIEYNPDNYRFIYLIIGVAAALVGLLSILGLIKINSNNNKINNCIETHHIWNSEKEMCE